MPQVDLLILTLPPNWLDDPPAAPAVLKSAVKEHGFTCQVLDFSLCCYQKIFSKNYNEYLDWCQILPGVYDLNKASQQHMDALMQAVDLCVNQIQKIEPRAVGLSIFSDWQHRFAFLLCEKIKASKLNSKVIIGGAGAARLPLGLAFFTRLSYFERKTNFADFMLRRKLIDHAVINDGEQELVKIMQNLDDYHSDLFAKEVNFDHRLLPDYDDYDFENYFYINNERKLLIRGSKGCVRQCVFCDEHRAYSKFMYNNGADLAEEIITLSQRYKIRKFQFTDSLVNGPLKSFREMIKSLAKYNQMFPEKSISWNGNYICRSHNSMSDTDYVELKQSGAHALTIGVESGSDRVLAEMQKQSTVADLLYEVEKFKEFGIDCYLLFMCGFYNETWEDFLDTIRLLKKLQPYVASGTVDSVRGGYTFLISDWKNYKAEDFEIDSKNRFNWLYKPNPDLTFKERCRRRVIFQEVCDELAIPLAYSKDDLLILESMYTDCQDLDMIESISAHN